MTAVLLVSHGSYSKKAHSEILRLFNGLKKEIKIPIFHYAFLEIKHPNIPQGIKRCISDGAKRIVILLNFLNTGDHVRHDIPRIVRKSLKKYPKVPFRISTPVGQHPRMTYLYRDVIRKSLTKS